MLSSLRHYWRTHTGVSCGVLLASAILTGALLVGDSVDYSLRETALARLGGIEHAIDLPNRFVAPNNGLFKNDQFYWDSYLDNCRNYLGLVRF